MPQEARLAGHPASETRAASEPRPPNSATAASSRCLARRAVRRVRLPADEGYRPVPDGCRVTTRASYTTTPIESVVP